MLYCAMIGLAATAVVIGHCQAQQSVGNSTELVQTPSAPAKPAQRSSPVAEGRIADAKGALRAAEKILGITLPSGASASLVKDPDETLLSDKPISVSDPAWLVNVPGAVFTLDWPKSQAPLPDGKTTVDTNPLDYEVLLRASSSAVLRIATKPIRIKIPAGTVRSLNASDYRIAAAEKCSQEIRPVEVQPKSTLREIYNGLFAESGYPLGAEQVVVHVWSWSERCAGRDQPRDVWCVEVRSDPSQESQTMGMETRLPEAMRPKVSTMTSVVEDGTNAPYWASNRPVPMIVDEAGVVSDPGDSAAGIAARTAPQGKSAEPAKRK